MSPIEKFRHLLSAPKKILISTHLFPDADGIGSQVALALALRHLGHDAICCNQEPLLDRYRYLDPEHLIFGVEETPSKYLEEVDLVIIVDTNSIHRTGDKIVNIQNKNHARIFYIDHHPFKNNIQDDYLIDISAAATGQVVGELIENLGVPFTQDMALALYTAILIDTSSFRYPTVSEKTHLLISKLMATGIEPPSAYNGIYGTKKINHLHMLGQILSSAHSTADEEIAWIVFSSEKIKEFNVDIEDTHSFINNLLILDNIKVACMFRDDGQFIKVSLRSNGVDDVGEIAEQLGGGGHSHSAAAIIKKELPLEEQIEKIIQKISLQLRTAP